MKAERRSKVLELIRTYEIETQEELIDYLRDAGFVATQGTVSRDIRDLSVTKVQSPKGKLIYTVTKDKKTEKAEKMSRVFISGIVTMELSTNILVIKTLEGMAMAVAATIDSMEDTGIIGTIAGDDTIFCVVRDAEIGASTIKRFKKLIGEQL